MAERKYVKLFPRFLQSAVYQDVNCRLVFLHLMLTCDDEGNATTSIRKLAEETGLSRRQIELALTKLLKKGSIAYLHRGQLKGRQTCHDSSVISLCHYASYQKNGKRNVTLHVTEARDIEKPDKESQSLESRAHKMVDWWNEVCVPKFNGRGKARMTPKRLAKAKQRLREDGWPEAFRACADHLPVPNDDRFTWQPDLDWFLANDTNVHKMVEGKYDKQRASSLFEGVFES